MPVSLAGSHPPRSRQCASKWSCLMDLEDLVSRTMEEDSMKLKPTDASGVLEARVSPRQRTGGYLSIENVALD